MTEKRLRAFLAKINKVDSGCWEWTAAKNPEGYGRFNFHANAKKIQKTAHRVSYEYFKGPIPEGLHLDHTCRNRACVNPDHLEPVTPEENLRRAMVYVRTVCTHDPSLPGSYHYWKSSKQKRCKICLAAYQRKRYVEKNPLARIGKKGRAPRWRVMVFLEPPSESQITPVTE